MPRPAVRRPDPGQDVGPGGALPDHRLADQPAQEPQVGHEPEDDGPVEGAREPLEGRGPVRPPGDDLGQHRVEPAADLAAELDPGVDADALAGGPGECLDPPGRREEAGVGILGIEPDLDGVPGGDAGRLGQAQALTGGDPQLIGDQVAAGHELRDGVLHLEPRVHLEEDRFATLVEQELAGPGTDVADRGGQPERRRSQPFPHRRGHGWRRGLLEHLLVAALDRAVAFAQRHARAIAIEQDLDLDVTCSDDEALQDQPVVAEGRGSLAPGGSDRLRQPVAARGPSACPCRRRRRPA